nr:ubiquitin hydrolase [Tanacetum cinerariifolium]
NDKETKGADYIYPKGSQMKGEDDMMSKVILLWTAWWNASSFRGLVRLLVLCYEVVKSVEADYEIVVVRMAEWVCDGKGCDIDIDYNGRDELKQEPTSLAVGSCSGSENFIAGSGNALCILFLTKSMEEVKYEEFGRPFTNNRNDGRFNREASGYNQPSSGERGPSLTEIINKYMEDAAKKHAEQDEWLGPLSLDDGWLYPDASLLNLPSFLLFVKGLPNSPYLTSSILFVRNKMHKAFPLPAIKFSLPEQLPTASETGLPECADNTVTDYSRPSPTVESSSEEDQNRYPFVSENVASPITPKPFVKFVKASDSQSKSKTDEKETPKKPPVKYAEQYKKSNKKPNVRGNQRNWNNLKSHQLGPDFVMKKKACFNCGDFNHLAYEGRKRVKRETTRSQKSPSHTPVVHRPNRSPMRSIRPNMNCACSNRTSFNKSAHSYTNRPF